MMQVCVCNIQAALAEIVRCRRNDLTNDEPEAIECQIELEAWASLSRGGHLSLAKILLKSLGRRNFGQTSYVCKKLLPLAQHALANYRKRKSALPLSSLISSSMSIAGSWVSPIIGDTNNRIWCIQNSRSSAILKCPQLVSRIFELIWTNSNKFILSLINWS